jgi:hypothetical protein
MEKTIKMFIETTDGKKLEQNVPEGLMEIYLEKGWKKVEKPIEKPAEKVEEKPFFSTKKTNKFKNN